jgi:copper(I)-binding protein
VSRAQQIFRAPRRSAVTLALAAGLGIAAAGCSAGQVTQTDTQVAAVNGASGDVGEIAVRDAQLQFPVGEIGYESGDDAPLVVTIVNNGRDEDRLVSITTAAAGEVAAEGDTSLEPWTAIVSAAVEESKGSSSPSSSGTASSSVVPTSGNPSSTGSPSSTGTPSSGSRATTENPSVTGIPDQSISNPPSGGESTRPTSEVEPREVGKVTITLRGITEQLRSGQTVQVTFVFEKAGSLTLTVPLAPSAEPRHDEESGH